MTHTGLFSFPFYFSVLPFNFLEINIAEPKIKPILPYSVIYMAHTHDFNFDYALRGIQLS